MNTVVVPSAVQSSVVNPHVKTTLVLLVSPTLLKQFVRMESARTMSVVHRIQLVRPLPWLWELSLFSRAPSHAPGDNPAKIPRNHVLARNVPQRSVASRTVLAMVINAQLTSTCWRMPLKCVPNQTVHQMSVVARIQLASCTSARLGSTKLPVLSVVERTAHQVNVVAKIPHVLIMCVQTPTYQLPLTLAVVPHAQRANAVRRPPQPPRRSLHTVRNIRVLRALKKTCEEIPASMLCALMSSAVTSRCHQQPQPLTPIRLRSPLRHLLLVVRSHVQLARSTGVLGEVAISW